MPVDNSTDLGAVVIVLLLLAGGLEIHEAVCPG